MAFLNSEAECDLHEVGDALKDLDDMSGIRLSI